MMRMGRGALLALAAAVVACSSTACSSTETPSGGATGAPVPTAETNVSERPGDEAGPPLQPNGGDPDAASPRFVDVCDLQSSVCTAAPAGFSEGDGLVAVDRCAFGLEESADLGTTTPALVTALETITAKVTVGDVLADANRTATKTNSVPGSPAGVAYAFRWQNDDNASTAWIPQGITGTADADASGTVGGKSAVLVSFYDSAEGGATNEGVRIAFVDTTTATSPKYRFALLVMPKGSAAAPTFDPVRIHAGGIVWFGDFLYVADTTHGFRIFDLRHILRVATDDGTFGCSGTTCRAAGYKYVLPQVGKYEVTSACKPLFSFVSLDRKSMPPALVSGEYCSTTACAGPLAGRVYRWPLDPATGLLRSKTTFPTEVNLTSHKQVQGGATVDGTYYLSSSAPAAAGGALYRVAGNKSATSNWSDSPEDLMVDHGNGWLWSLSEAPGARAVYAVKLSSYPKP
jgi:hypothetical protein